MHESRRLRQALILAALTICPPSVAAQPVIDMTMSLVPGDELSGGPVYDYRVGRFEVTNEQYAIFLNDALVNLDNERGQYMYFDIETGSVYIHSEITGTTGSGPGVTLLFDAEVNGVITYDSETSLYEVDVDQADHPVTGISWYGAVKFCNWFTLDQGLDIAQQAYTESTDDDLLGWHPVSISSEDWAVGDLDDDERLDLVDNYAGFRLPMDHGASGASAYSEWYKAAAWLPLAEMDAIYGFGRDVLTGADGNYLGSGDPFDDGATPVGYFNGTDYDGFVTVDTENGYGLYDMSGNVWEWQTDQGDEALSHSIRGGSWSSSEFALPNTVSSIAGADSVQTTWGFRVVQSVKDVLQVVPDVPVAITGPYGGEYDIPEQIYTITNLTPETVLVNIIPDVVWLTVDELSEVINLELIGKSSIDVVVAVVNDCDVDQLVVGVNVGTLTFSNDAGGDDIVREVDLTVTEPVSVAPDESTIFEVEGFFDGPFEDTQVYTLTSESASDIPWLATSDQTDPAWLLIDGAASAGGTLIPPNDVTADVTVSFDVTANDLDVGTHTAVLTFTDECTSEAIERTVNLIINAPMTVLPEDAIEFEGVFGGPYTPETVELTLTNLLDVDLIWEAEGTTESGSVWLDINGELLATGTLLAGEEAVLTLTVNSNADALDPETYTLTLNVSDINNSQHVFMIELEVTLEIVELDVSPTDDLFSSGPVGGPFTPSEQVYTITNREVFELAWLVTSDVDWIDLNGGASDSGIIVKPEGTADVTVAINAVAQTLAVGTHEATVTFEDLVSGGSVERLVTLDVGASDFTTPMVIVDGEDEQAGGPTYRYRIGLYEITNAEYATFLSNAVANLDNERGYFMYHDTDTGDVYVNDSEQGETGSGAGDLTTLMFSAAAGAAITYDGVEYVVEEGMEDLPVVGVTWFGAVKFCNWMTVAQGMDAAQRVYHEGPTPEEWFPVTMGSEINGSQADTYATRDLNDDERDDLVTGYNGFRLPMDHGVDQAGLYSEWYKAAAFVDVEEPEALYGFGRDVITGADANYLTSGDPLDEGPTPVGYFDGTDHDGEFATTDTDNLYGLYDLTGNVREWMQDFGDDSTERTVRGGHFQSGQAASALQTDTRVSRPREDVQAHTGFRVVQSPTVLPLELTETTPLLAHGAILGPYDPESLTITVSAETIGAANEWRIDLDVNWVEIDGAQSSSGVTQPGADDTIVIDFNDATGDLRIPLAPALVLALVAATETGDQAGGPDYDFWISPTEVTNSAYAAFLNDALANRENERGAFMYHDTDSGRVYINEAETGESGETGSDTLTTLLFDASVNVRITFDIDDSESYVIEAGFENHPVVGVTWYGAVKYCNWLTIDRGFDPGVRTYTEGSYAGDWHPVSITTLQWWGTEDTANEPVPIDAARDLDDAERALLAGNYTGFRLPMDNGAALASVYNEWYKAAAWLPHADPPTEALYGFGRDVLSGPDDVCEPADDECDADANYACSGDPFEDASDCNMGSTTPSGFYDGTIYNPDATVDDDQVADEDDDTPDFVTAADENGYGLVDVTGNVAEWVQDRGTLLTDHTVRGGHWADTVDASALHNSSRTDAAPDTPTDTIGFRVVQSFRAHQAIVTVTDLTAGTVTTIPLLLSLSEPVTFTPEDGIITSGLYGDDFTSVWVTYTATNASETEMEWDVTVDQTWVTVTPSDDVFDPIPGHDGTDPGSDTVDVEINEEASSLVPGEHVATVTFDNLTTGHSETRLVELTIEQTIDVDPVDPIEVTGIAGGPFEPAVVDYTMANTIATDLEYSIDAGGVSWLTIEEEDTTGTLPGDGTAVTFDVTVNEEANDLEIGEHTATITINDTSFGGVVTREINLTVGAPLVVVGDDFEWAGPFGGPFVEVQDYILTNEAIFPLDWVVTVDQTWLTVDDSDTSDGQLDPGDSVIVTVAFSDETLGLPGGVYTGLITFTELQTGFEQTRDVTLSIDQGLAVTPLAAYDAYAPVNGETLGEIIPHQFVYQLTNLDPLPVDYSVSASPAWILVNGVPAVAGTLGVEESKAIFVTIDPIEASKLPPGFHQGSISIENASGTSGSTMRDVSLTLVVPTFDVNTAEVSGLDDAQPNGPTYRFEIARFEVTNDDFAVFLNDALTNPDNERGAFMYHDTDSGNVYINDSETGESGDAGSDDLTTRMFDSSISARITFVVDTYVVESGFEDHPVVGVSWYGAVKYCNWLTIDQGFPPDHRCYLESTSDDLFGWRPATISADDWADGDLDDAERQALVTHYAGYRLPMDDGASNPDSMTDSADDYNEWYKAAAWNTAADQNTLYGFGRDVVGGADANYLASGDPFDDATTPVEYYDGTDHGGTFQTNDTDNSFGLHDMSGNVLEMVQGRFDPPGPLVTTRSTSYLQGPQQVSVRSGNFANNPNPTVGFRVLRVPITLLGDSDGDGDVDLLDLGAFQACFTGPDVPNTEPACSIFDFDADADIDLVDFGQLQDSITGP